MYFTIPVEESVWGGKEPQMRLELICWFINKLINGEYEVREKKHCIIRLAVYLMRCKIRLRLRADGYQFCTLAKSHTPKCNKTKVFKYQVE